MISKPQFDHSNSATSSTDIDREGQAFDLKIEPAKIIDLILSKQTQYYSLWAVYTAVQFAASSFGSNQKISLSTAIAVIVGVWTFNIGHLGFVLSCVEQINKLQLNLDAALEGDQDRYKHLLVNNFKEIGITARIGKAVSFKDYGEGFGINLVVHLIIDLCASAALLSRIQ